MQDGGVSCARGHWVGDRSSTACCYGGPLTRGPAQASNKQSHLGSQVLGQCPIPLQFVLEELNYKRRAPTEDCSSCKHRKAASKCKSSALIVVSSLGDAIFRVNNVKKQMTVKRLLLQSTHLKGHSRVHRVPSNWSQHICSGEYCYNPDRTDQRVVEVLGSPRAKLR